MDFLNSHILSVIIFFPLAAAIGILLIPKEEKKLLYGFSMVFTLVEFALSIYLYCSFTGTSLLEFEFLEKKTWIDLTPYFSGSNWKIQYLIGIDGVSLLLVMLTTLLTPLIILASVHSITDKVKEFVISLLVLEASMIGVFCALDLFLFYVFWEVMLIPMYLVIGVWGGKDKIYAAIKFFIYTMSGSVLMLLGILYLFFKSGTLSLVEIYALPNSPLAGQAELWVFLAFALAFAIKVPLFPLHTWLPNAHVEAPTAGSVILAGVLLKMGTYGFFRFAMPLFPEALKIAQPYLIILSVIGIIYGALVALVQTDIKKLIAYSSVSHLGIVMLGLFALDKTAMQGGLYQMLNHGISTGALFLLVGMIYERTHSREISAHGGIAKIIPIYTFYFMVVTFSSIGLPLTNGFVGEFLSLIGTFKNHPIAAILGTTGVVLSAFYMLWLVERFFFGPLKSPVGLKIPDISWQEVSILTPLVILIIWMGVYPQPFLKKLERPVDALMMRLEDKVEEEVGLIKSEK